MLGLWNVLILVSYALAVPVDDYEVPFVEPEVLDQLLENGDYEEFSRLMGIDDVSLVIPKEGNDTNPMYHKELPHGDLILTKEQTEQAEQGRALINFNRYPGSKWRNGIVPYHIASSGFSSQQRAVIEDAIRDYNSKNTGTRFVPRRRQRDYVMIFSGEGCYSILGKSRNQQPLSLQSNGCVHKGIVQHEMMHAVGVDHEQSRPDRDNFIRMLWDNIPREWHSQYEKGNADDFVMTTYYDYYSIMHYGIWAPGSGKKAFDVLMGGIDENRLGQIDGMTPWDVDKIRNSYR